MVVQWDVSVFDFDEFVTFFGWRRDVDELPVGWDFFEGSFHALETRYFILVEVHTVGESFWATLLEES